MIEADTSAEPVRRRLSVALSCSSRPQEAGGTFCSGKGGGKGGKGKDHGGKDCGKFGKCGGGYFNEAEECVTHD